MPRPEPREITFEIDGREVAAPEGEMLVDAAKNGDVEIPYFCYERKLGQPVGACRMCLVEIEGIPKLQTSCSTPVKDGMVVNTTSERVKAAQNAVVEFLLINHPLDCPVCDKGGECPLQDISFGWGAGRSRYIEPKRHFKKPLELSPLIAIDRERCILCYRCVRFSQEVAEDYQLVFLERGDHTFVGTHDGRPYVAPFSGNILELCPVGALTSTSYRFRARPWDIEASGGLCTLCPSQCNVNFTVRDDKVVRVNCRDNHDVDDGWLCDKGRFAYQSIHARERITTPLVRDGGALREVSWERALDEAAGALEKAGANAAALVGGGTTNEEGFLVQHLMRKGLGSPHVDSRSGGSIDAEQARVLARTDLAASVPDIEWAGAILVVETELVDEAPILDLRVRKAARRHGARVVTLTSHPSTLDPNAAAALRFAPGSAEAALGALAAALGSPRTGLSTDELALRAGLNPGLQAALPSTPKNPGQALEAAAAVLRDAPEVVVIWGERVAHGARGKQAIDALLALAGTLGVQGTEGAGLIEVPADTNARGLREAGCLPNMGPGLKDAAEPGRSAAEIGRALGEGELSSVLLMGADPLRDFPERPVWEAAMDGAGSVDRLRRLPHRGARGARHRRLPRRVLRREGGHAHAPRRAPAARAPGDRPPGRDARRLVGAGRAVRAGGRRPRRGRRAGGLRAGGQGGPFLGRRHLRGARRQGRALAGARHVVVGSRGGGPRRAARGPARGDRRAAAGRHRLAVVGPGDRERARAALPHPPPARRAQRRRRPAARRGAR